MTESDNHFFDETEEELKLNSALDMFCWCLEQQKPTLATNNLASLEKLVDKLTNGHYSVFLENVGQDWKTTCQNHIKSLQNA